MGAGGSVPNGQHATLFGDGENLLNVNKEIEAELHKIRSDTNSTSSMHSTKNGRTTPSASAAGATGGTNKDMCSDDDEDERRSVCTIATRASSQHAHGGIHSALAVHQPSTDALRAVMLPLPRGGVYVRTKMGAIQFGIPPDTIKDSMSLGLTVPSIFVVPQERFNLTLGINVAEIEFPSYFNFFILQTMTRVLVTHAQERSIRKAFEETLEGPADEFLYQDDEYSTFVDPKRYEGRPNLRKEIDFFKEPRNGRVISTETLLHFLQFDSMGRADIVSAMSKPPGHAKKKKRSGESSSRDSSPRTPDSADESTMPPSEEEGEEKVAAEPPKGDDAGPSAKASDTAVATEEGYSLVIRDLRFEERYIVLEDGVEIASVSYQMASFAPSPEILEKQFKDTVILERELEANLDNEFDLDDGAEAEAEAGANAEDGACANACADTDPSESKLDVESKGDAGAVAQAEGQTAEGQTETQVKAGKEKSSRDQDGDGDEGGAGAGTQERLRRGRRSNSSPANLNDPSSTPPQQQSFQLPSGQRDTKRNSNLLNQTKLDDELYLLLSQGSFIPPDFGVTMLGNSDGFDKSGSTTGFIVWMYGYGVAVDPPAHCDAYLMMNGVSPRLVTTVILTHCHADHDAGTFQKILKERRVRLVTTRTVYEHFIRKYSAVSGLRDEFLKRLFDFHEVKLAEPTYLHGGVFEFFYALHALPCVGFKVTCGGKTLSYSADTYNDPEGLSKLEERGIISAARKQQLLDFPWDCDVVLHECGVPPIHTPPSTLQNQPDSVKKNLYAVHITDANAEAAGLRKALAGFDNTIVIENEPRPNQMAINVLQLCAEADIFREADIKQCIHILQMSEAHSYTCGTEFTGTVGGVFFIVARGVLKVERKGKGSMILRLGDYFGEISAMTGASEEMKLTAVTDVEIVDINKFAFNQFLDSCPDVRKRLTALKAMRSQGFSSVLRRNPVLANLTFPQKTALQSLTKKPRIIEPHDALVKIGEVNEYIYIVCKGEFLVTADGVDAINHNASFKIKSSAGGINSSGKHGSKSIVMRRSMFGSSSSSSRGSSVAGRVGRTELRTGGLFISAQSFRHAISINAEDTDVGIPQEVALVARSRGSVFEIHMDDFRDFLLRNPGIQLALMKHPTGVVAGLL